MLQHPGGRLHRNEPKIYSVAFEIDLVFFLATAEVSGRASLVCGYFCFLPGLFDCSVPAVICENPCNARPAFLQNVFRLLQLFVFLQFFFPALFFLYCSIIFWIDKFLERLLAHENDLLFFQQ